ncbi:MAG: anaerobic ribonucleoside-triphosphate reductase activating protein [Candidatus Omnitrophica bacterium]|nr:anaerobic ribonucleoside-triphosphate reductase activating protein [Candidatus Omnitrophota bacterium]MDD5737036.1 anaerobic ribonucleoside-triphosphate reductase activating protein [Candidatus Omnitrophota bacterium]
MKIGGLVKCSFIDYPGKISAVIFTQGCNFRCPYCHNPQLVYPGMFEKPIPFTHVYDFLRERRGLLDAVVFCGGEPTLQADLPEKIRAVKALGYFVKIDTNGSRPDVLAEILPYLDYIAMDVKAPFGPAYSSVCGVSVDDYEIRRSMLLIRASGIPYEFRTVFHSGFMVPNDLEAMRNIFSDKEKHIVTDISR